MAKKKVAKAEGAMEKAKRETAAPVAIGMLSVAQGIATEATKGLAFLASLDGTLNARTVNAIERDAKALAKSVAALQVRIDAHTTREMEKSAAAEKRAEAKAIRIAERDAKKKAAADAALAKALAKVNALRKAAGQPEIDAEGKEVAPAADDPNGTQRR